MAKLDKSILTSWAAEVEGSLEEDKYHIQYGVALLSLVVNEHGEVMALSNPSKENKHHKGHHDLVSNKRSQLFKRRCRRWKRRSRK